MVVFGGPAIVVSVGSNVVVEVSFSVSVECTVQGALVVTYGVLSRVVFVVGIGVVGLDEKVDTDCVDDTGLLDKVSSLGFVEDRVDFDSDVEKCCELVVCVSFGKDVVDGDPNDVFNELKAAVVDSSDTELVSWVPELVENSAVVNLPVTLDGRLSVVGTSDVVDEVSSEEGVVDRGTDDNDVDLEDDIDGMMVDDDVDIDNVVVVVCSLLVVLPDVSLCLDNGVVFGVVVYVLLFLLVWS